MGWSRRLAHGQTARVHLYDTSTGEDAVIHVEREVLLEAPNWTVDDHVILNGDGVLWRLPVDGSRAPDAVDIEGLPELNNDHVLAPDGERIFVSANDGHLYSSSLVGGIATRVSPDDAAHWHFLHGVSPDGSRLAYVALNPAEGWDSGTLHVLDLSAGSDTALLTGPGPDDGPEYSPDGEWLYFNTERFSRDAGHAQIARIRPDGTDLQQLTFDERVNWFPHLDPTGARAVYLSYAPGTDGHPADRIVQLRLIEDPAAPAWSEPRIIVELQGGQGTINVNSWSPDGRRFAYVDYPQEEQGEQGYVA